MVSSPDDEDAASSYISSLHILLVSNLPLGTIQTSPSVKSTERLSPNMILFRLAPGTTTLVSADSAHSDVAFQVVRDNSGNMLQLPEFLIWYPLPSIGGGAPQLLNKSPTGRELLVYSKMLEKEGARRGRRGGGDDDDEHNNSRSRSSKLAAGESIAIRTADTSGTTAAEVVVPIHSAEKRRWRLGYYVVAPRYPCETIAKLLGGGQRPMSPLWFSSRDSDSSSGELEQPSEEKDGEDVEMEEADDDGEDEEDEDDENDEDDGGDYEGSSSSIARIPPPPTKRKSTREARARRRRRRRRQLAEEDTRAASKPCGVGRRSTAAKGTKASKDRLVDEVQDEDGSEDTDDDDKDEEEDEGYGGEKAKAGRERSGRDHTSSRPGPDPGSASLSAALPWAAVAAAGGIRLKGRVDILPLGRPRPD
ncbi:hypothetical protein PG985_009996 [Apiospora marii]|uniref:uncharacterized protein n=1 Tax=Apiospora marii TaxID=335849 RepID=UPI003132125E